MPIASIEIGPIAELKSEPFYGRCVRQESLTISGTTATLGNAITAAEVKADGVLARISTDSSCYFAVGSGPDPTAVASSAATGARRFLPANTWIDVVLLIGEKVAVKAP